MSDQPSGELILYTREDGAPAIEVRLDGDTVWLSQQQLADLFQTSRTNVVEHVRHIYEEGELDEAATCRNFRQVRIEGEREVARAIPHYNLDLIISLGYRVGSRVATRVDATVATLIARARPMLALWKTAARATPMPHWQSKTPAV